MKEKNRNIVAFIDRLGLSEKEKEKLEYGANLMKRYSNITFSVISYENQVLIIKTKQGKNYTAQYDNKKTLIEKTKKLFTEFSDKFKPLKINVGAIPYAFPKSEIITPEYLKKELQKRKIRIKDIHDETGIETSNLSAWINEVRPMSNIVKNMFYYYLTYKEKTK